jgi:hypothetical protein
MPLHHKFISMRDLSTQFIGCRWQTRRFAKARGDGERKEKQPNRGKRLFEGLDLTRAGSLLDSGVLHTANTSDHHCRLHLFTGMISIHRNDKSEREVRIKHISL